MKLLTVESDLFEAKKKQIYSFETSVQQQHSLLHNKSTGMNAWVDWPVSSNATEMVQKIKEESRKVQSVATVMVVIGVGGSFLGAQACCDFLTYEKCDGGIEVVFAGWNVSDSYHAALLEKLADEEVVICVISKSGGTMETVFAFDLFKEFLKQKYGADYSSRIYVITGKNQGKLRLEAEREGYYIFDLDENIGGRYSVLTEVGMFPVAVRGFDIEKIINGAAQAYDDLNTSVLTDNPCYQYAILRHLLFEEGRYVEVFSVMSPHIYTLNEWLKQLFAESEGKEGRGILPFSVRYSTDLHSIGQYFEQGNPICFESLIYTEDGKGKLSITYKGKTYRELSKIVCDAVYQVRQDNHTPIFRFMIHRPIEKACGYLLYFFEKACAMCCLLQEINPFDQPGVEAYKNQIKKLLKEDISQ